MSEGRGGYPPISERKDYDLRPSVRRTCWTCSHAIWGLEFHPSNRHYAVILGCDRALRNSSYPCEKYEREPGVD